MKRQSLRSLWGSRKDQVYAFWPDDLWGWGERVRLLLTLPNVTGSRVYTQEHPPRRMAYQFTCHPIKALRMLCAVTWDEWVPVWELPPIIVQYTPHQHPWKFPGAMLTLDTKDIFMPWGLKKSVMLALVALWVYYELGWKCGLFWEWNKTTGQVKKSHWHVLHGQSRACRPNRLVIGGNWSQERNICFMTRPNAQFLRRGTRVCTSLAKHPKWPLTEGVVIFYSQGTEIYI